ncbi:MAG: ComF family protein [Gemmatimonadota bacterium]
MEAEACRECRTWPPALTRARYAVLLKPPADALVHGLKYEGWRGLAVEMGEAMARAARSSMRRDGWGADGVVAVPTTAKRRRRRGYNQARLLAHVVAEQLELPVSGALKRVRGGATQVSLPPALRLDNVRGAFTPAPGAGSVVTGRHLLLVDDVLTTGATACAAAEALHGAGAASVTLVTFARALPFQEKVDTF